MSTASPSARWRSRWVLSSREVKSTGVKFFVVILPSTVTANVTATKGRFGGASFRTSDFFEERRVVGRAEARPSDDVLLFLLADFMLERGEFLLHFAHLHVSDGAARPVEEIDEAARQTTEQDHSETGQSDHACDRRRDSAKIEEHDLKKEL